MAYEMVMPYHLHMPSYFLETFTEYPYANQPIFGRASLALTSKMIAEFLKYVFIQPQTMVQSCEAF